MESVVMRAYVGWKGPGWGAIVRNRRAVEGWTEDDQRRGNRTMVCHRRPWTASPCIDAVMFTLGVSPKQEERDDMQSYAG